MYCSFEKRKKGIEGGKNEEELVNNRKEPAANRGTDTRQSKLLPAAAPHRPAPMGGIPGFLHCSLQPQNLVKAFVRCSYFTI